MITFGRNITQKNDPLQKIEPERFYRLLKNPPEGLRSQIKQLRTVLSLDQGKYRTLKTKLPYVCCGIFNPPYRLTANFASASHFILDIDHLKEKELEADTLKQKLSEDSRVHLIFVSPGKDGLKILFRMDRKCFDHAKYSIFYKVFAHAFSKQYELQQVIDTRTSDVTRACFVSYDPDAIFNPLADKVNMEAFVDFNNETQVKEAQNLIKEENKEQPGTPDNKPEISGDILQEIKQKLNPNLKKKAEKQIYVPEELNAIIEKVRQKLGEYQIEILDIQNIHYGKKFKCKLQEHLAEVNVFYGRKGYSVVKSPKRGTNAELNDIVHKLLCELFFN
ncbi:MAG: virulence protein E [Bacteroidales bacterium]|nr:virulence protein E [Bacteroidales bacterium]MCF8398522.1 virulence protein E [Bacteroidales bacterium]